MTFKAIGRGEINVNIRQSRIGVARLLEPADRFVDARSQQMRDPNPDIPVDDVGIAGTEADSLLRERDRLVYRTRHDLANAKTGECAKRVAVEREHRLVFGNGFLVSPVQTQQIALRVVRDWAAGRGR